MLQSANEEVDAAFGGLPAQAIGGPDLEPVGPDGPVHQWEGRALSRRGLSQEFQRFAHGLILVFVVLGKKLVADIQQRAPRLRIIAGIVDLEVEGEVLVLGIADTGLGDPCSS